MGSGWKVSFGLRKRGVWGFEGSFLNIISWLNISLLTISDYNRVLSPNGFVCNCLREVNSQEC